MSDDAIERILEDAYQMGRTDANLKTDDYKVLMPKMKKKLAQQIRSYVSEKEFEAYKRGIEDEIKCVENSGEHVDLQAKMAEQRRKIG